MMLKMFALRFLLCIAVLSNCNEIFALSRTHHHTLTSIYSSADSAGTDKGSLFINAAHLTSESCLPQHDGPKPKVFETFVDGTNQFIWGRKNEIPLLYLAFSETIGLKLDSHSISYPFHSFP